MNQNREPRKPEIEKILNPNNTFNFSLSKEVEEQLDGFVLGLEDSKIELSDGKKYNVVDAVTELFLKFMEMDVKNESLVFKTGEGIQPREFPIWRGKTIFEIINNEFYNTSSYFVNFGNKEIDSSAKTTRELSLSKERIHSYRLLLEKLGLNIFRSNNPQIQINTVFDKMFSFYLYCKINKLRLFRKNGFQEEEIIF